ncbi:MAG: choice-of-anchor J domain-containing protein [Mangrovibacterium sp.]
MKNIFKFLGIFVLLLSFNSCIEEYGSKVYEGGVAFKVTAPESVTASAEDLTMKVKLYRDYTGETTTLYLNVASVDDSLITTESSTIEYGNYELTLANVFENDEPLYVAVDATDDRAVSLDASTLIPMAENVIADETTTYALSTVLFDPNKDEVVDAIAEPYTYAFDGTAGDPVSADGWINVNVSGTNVWQYKSFKENSYAQMSANKGGGGAYDTWMISPALDLDAVANKTISFKSLTGYANGAQLKLFLLDGNNPATATKTELTYTVAPDTEGGYAADFTESGVVNLLSYSGVVYIGFEYVGEDGQTTTFQVDDFNFAVDEATGGGDEDYTIASFLALEDEAVGTVEGEVMEVTVNSSYGTVTSLVLKDAANAELLVYGVFKVSDVIYEVGQTLKVTGERDNYNGTDQLSLNADTGSIEVIDDGGDTDGGGEIETGLLFAGSNFENWDDFLGGLNSYGLKDYASQSADGGRSGSSALYIAGTPSTNDYLFKVLTNAANLPENPTKITFYIKGTSESKSLSLNIYDADGNYAKANVGEVSSTDDINLDLSASQNDYSGSIDTGGEWVKVTIDVTGYTFATDADTNFFAIKVGKESLYDLYIDDIIIENSISKYPFRE